MGFRFRMVNHPLDFAVFVRGIGRRSSAAFLTEIETRPGVGSGLFGFMPRLSV